jgi:GNAT superfamily N-acetyltransferase
VRIRDAKLEDAQAIAEVHLASWRTTYPGIIPQAYIDGLRVADGAARWRQWLGETSAIAFVAEDDAGIFGFVSGGAMVHPVDGYDGELGAIYLLATHQRNGAGRALVQRLAQTLRQRGFRSCVVWALEANSACRFYERLGGVRVASQPIEIGGVSLTEIAFGWAAIGDLCSAAEGAPKS